MTLRSAIPHIIGAIVRVQCDTLTMNDTRNLTNELAALLRREHGALGDFLVALAQFDRGFVSLILCSSKTRGG
jgi:hypothetical protein